jgi:hypothetical protein
LKELASLPFAMRSYVLLLPLWLAACGTQAPRPVIERTETPGAVSPAPTPRAEAGKPAPAIKYSGGPSVAEVLKTIEGMKS